MQVLVEPSPSRAYSINEYKAAGAIISSDFSTADVIVGELMDIHHALKSCILQH